MGKKVKVIVDVTELGRKGGEATAANRTSADRSSDEVLAEGVHSTSGSVERSTDQKWI
jgi:hypothetical protein